MQLTLHQKLSLVQFWDLFYHERMKITCFPKKSIFLVRFSLIVDPEAKIMCKLSCADQQVSLLAIQRVITNNSPVNSSYSTQFKQNQFLLPENKKLQLNHGNDHVCLRNVIFVYNLHHIDGEQRGDRGKATNKGCIIKPVSILDD